MLDQPGHILVQVVEGLVPLPALLFGLPCQTFRERGGPHVKLGFIFTWDAQYPANHRHRQRIGEAFDEIDLALVSHLIEEGGDDAQHLGTKLLQVCRAFWRTKVAHRQATQAVVLRGVQADKPIRIRGGPWSSPGLRTVSRIGTDARIMQQRLDLAIGTHDVRPPLVGAIFLPAHRGLAQLRPQRVGVRAIGIVEDLS